MSPALPRWQILAAALLFSTGGAAIKATAWGGWQVACVRSAIGAMVLWLLIPEARGRLTIKVGLVSLAYAATLVLFALANKLTTAANAIFLQGTFPIYVILLGPWLLGERAHRRDLPVLVVLALGMGLVFMGEDQASAIATDPARGNLLALGAGVFWALTVMGFRVLVESAPEGTDPSHFAARGAALGNVVAALICLPMAWPLEPGTTTDWLVLFYLGAFQVGLAYVFMTRGMPHVSALVASMLLLSEPVFSTGLAALVHGELPSVLAAVGGGVILGALGLQAWLSPPAGPLPDT